jgi:hypothetical protein
LVAVVPDASLLVDALWSDEPAAVVVLASLEAEESDELD